MFDLNKKKIYLLMVKDLREYLLIKHNPGIMKSHSRFEFNNRAYYILSNLSEYGIPKNTFIFNFRSGF